MRSRVPNYGVLAALSVLGAAPRVAALPAPGKPGAPVPAGKPLAVAIGAFSGERHLSDLVVETLLTDFAKSDRLSLLDTRGAGSAKSAQLVPYCVAGSCYLHDGLVAINARVVARATGRTVPGLAQSVEGPRSHVVSLAHQLASRLAPRIIAACPAVAATRTAHASANHPTLSASVPHPTVGGAVLDPGAITRLAEPPAEVPTGMTTVLRTASLHRAQQPTGAAPITITGDDTPSAAAAAEAGPAATTKEQGDRYTGVIIDATGLKLERSMSPSIRRMDGTVLWNGAEAAPDYVVEDGIVAYAADMDAARSNSRAGSHPLVLKAVGLRNQPFASDPTLSDTDAELLVACAKRDGVLKAYRVVIVTGK